MNQHSEESDDQKVALFFPKVPSIIRELSIIIFGVTFLVGGFGAILFWLPKLQTAIALKPAVGDRAIGLFSVYVAVSLAIESTIEIYLKALPQGSSEVETKSDQDNPDTNSNSSLKSDNKRIATIASLIVGTAVSFAGVRFLEPFFEISSLEDYQAQLFHAVDILLTAGLLSGGSDGIHQVTRLYQDRVDKFKKL